METKEQSIFYHQNNEIKTKDKTITYTIQSQEPFIAVLEDVLNEDECEALIALSKNRLQRSKVGKTRDVEELRTSSGMFFEEGENEIIEQIEHRIAEIMCIPVEHAEGLQILHYEIGQEYKPHMDYFKSTDKRNDNPRISTLVMYLSDVEEGGETYFPSLGISVSPKKGSAVYFEYFYEEQALNEGTLHGSSPVVKGDKWAATQWMRRKRVR